MNEVQTNVQKALLEDIGSGDVSSELINEQEECSARVIFRSEGVFCGQPWVNEVATQMESSFSIDWLVNDGQFVEPNTRVCNLHGAARSILTAERTLLNFLQLLSGTATITRQYCSLIAHTPTQILDTRKTLPGLRYAQKYAVRQGGGSNHRMGLFDAFLIKENHIKAAGSIKAAVDRARSINPTLLLQVEAEDLQQLEECLALGVKRVLLDNFSIQGLREAVVMTRDSAQLEASGGISLESVVEVAETGVHFISIGAITKHVHAVDLTLLID